MAASGLILLKPDMTILVRNANDVNVWRTDT